MKTTIVLLNWNGYEDTVACLESLLAARPTNFSIIVCDNDSHDGSVDKLTLWAEQNLPDNFLLIHRTAIDDGQFLMQEKKLALVQNGGNLGFAGGCNPGIRLALQDPDCEYVWLLNNDTVIEPDALAKAVEHMEDNPDMGICGSTLIYYHDRAKVQAWGGAHFSPVSGRSYHIGAFADSSALPSGAEVSKIENNTSYVIGAAMLIRRNVFQRIGLLDESYFLYFEELDFATRCKSHFRLGYAPLSRVYHKEGASIGTHASGGSLISIYYLYRNRLRFTWKHGPQWLPTVICYSLLDIAKLLLKNRPRHAWVGFKALLGLSYR